MRARVTFAGTSGTLAAVETVLALGVAAGLVSSDVEAALWPLRSKSAEWDLVKVFSLAAFLLGLVVLTWWANRTIPARSVRVAAGGAAAFAGTVLFIGAMVPALVVFLTPVRALLVLGISTIPAAAVGSWLWFIGRGSERSSVYERARRRSRRLGMWAAALLLVCASHTIVVLHAASFSSMIRDAGAAAPSLRAGGIVRAPVLLPDARGAIIGACEAGGVGTPAGSSRAATVLFLTPEHPKSGYPAAQLQLAFWVRSGAGIRLHQAANPPVLVHLNEAQAAAIRRRGIPSELVDAMLSAGQASGPGGGTFGPATVIDPASFLSGSQ